MAERDDIDEEPAAEAQAADAPETPEDEVYSEDGALRPEFMERVFAALEAGDREALIAEVGELHESELGDLLESVGPDERQQLVTLLGDDFDFSALTEVDEAIRLEIVESLPNASIAKALGELDSDDAVYILEDLEPEDQEDILARLPFIERIRLRRSLSYPEATAGRRMQTEFVAVPPFWTVGQTIDYLRDDGDLPETFSQVFVIDPTFKLLGAVDLD
jgi:magnesium transporter